MRAEPFLQTAFGEYQDRGRDNVPDGYVWALKDFVPYQLGAMIRGRGGWTYLSQALAGSIMSMVYAPFRGGAQEIVVILEGGQVYTLPLAGTTATLRGSIVGPARQNPIWWRDRIYVPSYSGNFWRISRFGAPLTLDSYPSSLAGAWAGTIYKDRLVLANDGSSAYSRVAFSKPGDPTATWDSTSWIDTSDFVRGLEAMRNQILVFHDDFVEQIRGTTPPDAALSDPTGDMQLSVLWDRAGCLDARSIAKWQENVIFADERGVHITDGGLVRNLIEQGGMSSPWRAAFEGWIFNAGDDLSGVVYGNYYIASIRVAASGLKQVWICDLPTRRWFRWTNIDSVAFAVTAGTSEQLVATHQATNRVTSLNACWKPNALASQVDGNGTNVLPEVETPWQRLSRRMAFRRIYDAFLYYLVDSTTTNQAGMVELAITDSPEDTTYEVVGTLGEAATAKRRKLLVARRAEGVAFRIRALLAHTDFRVNSLSVSMEQEEEHRI